MYKLTFLLVYLVSVLNSVSFSQDSWNSKNYLKKAGLENDSLLISFEHEAAGPFTISKMEISGNMTNADVWRIPGGIDSVEVWCRGGFAKDSWEFAVEAPGGEVALQINRSKLIPNKWDGWMIAMFDFSAETPLNSQEMEKVKNGERTIALDVYFEELDSEHTFQILSDHEINDGDFGTKKLKGGIKFQMRLGKEADFTGGTNWFIAREAYLTRNGQWQTLYFSADEPGEPDLNFSVPANEVDRIWFIPNYSYRYGESNKFYIKNLRIVDMPLDTIPPLVFPDYPKLTYSGATWSRWAVQMDEPGNLLTIIKEASELEPSVEDFTGGQVIPVSRGALVTNFSIEGLNPNTEYTAYFLGEDTIGNKQGSITTVSFTTESASIPPPAFADNYPEAYAVVHNAFNIRYKLDKPGVLYFKRVKDSDPVPDMQEILNGGNRIIYDYQLEHNLFFSGLKDNTVYHTYFLLEDFENPVNISEEPVILETKTKVVGEPHTPDTESHNPLVITDGGVFENMKINSTDYNTPAITISTTEPVTIKNCVISGSGDLIVAAVSKVKVTIEHNYIWGRNPNISGQQQGRSVSVGDANYFIFRNNFTSQTGGARIAGFNGASEKSIVFEGNIHIDLTSLVSNGTGNPGRAGYDISKDNGGALNRQMLILNNVDVPSGVPAPKIMYNLIENNEYNEDNVSSTEDLINIFGSIGPSTDNPILVGRNFLRGAHGNEPFNPYRPFTGTGIVMDASNASGADFGNIEIFENYISYAQNSGIGISSGHHIKVFDNKIVNPLIGENGEQISGYYGNGIYVWAWKEDRPVTHTEVFENKVHNYKSKDQEPGSNLGRNDWWFPDCFDTNDCNNNEKLPGPLNHEDVLKMYCEFFAMLEENEQSLGPDWGPAIDLLSFSPSECPLLYDDIEEIPMLTYDLMVFPNPAGEKLHVTSKDLMIQDAFILDISGRVLLNKSYSIGHNQIELPLDRLKGGTYILCVSDNEKIVRKIFTKE